jgi:hypothetical protein
MDQSTYNKYFKLCCEEYHKGIITHNEWMRKKTELFIKKRLFEEESKRQKIDEFKKTNLPDECSICCESVQLCDQLECGHYTHFKCLQQFQESGHKLFYECPVCKHQISNMIPEFDLDNKNLRCRYEHIDGSIETVVYDDNINKYWILSKKNHRDFFMKVTTKCFELSEQRKNQFKQNE